MMETIGFVFLSGIVLLLFSDFLKRRRDYRKAQLIKLWKLDETDTDADTLRQGSGQADFENSPHESVRVDRLGRVSLFDKNAWVSWKGEQIFQGGKYQVEFAPNGDQPDGCTIICELVDFTKPVKSSSDPLTGWIKLELLEGATLDEELVGTVVSYPQKEIADITEWEAA